MTSKGRLNSVERLYSGKYSVTITVDRVDGIEALNGADLDVEIKKAPGKAVIECKWAFVEMPW